MIRKSVLTFLILLLTHSIFVKWINYKPFDGQNQYQYNLIKGQHYLYAQQLPEVCLIGTSLTQNVRFNDQSINNLALGGLSVFDGLSIITKSERYPKKLLVELNVLDRCANSNFTEQLFGTYHYYTRKWAVSLQEKYQPYSIAGELTNTFFERGRDTPTTLNKPVDSLLSTRLISLLNLELSKKITVKDKLIILRNAENLFKQLEILQKKGVDIILFKVPKHCALLDTEKEKFTQHVLSTYIKIYDFQLVPEYPCELVATTDGNHLTENSLKVFSSYLEEETK